MDPSPPTILDILLRVIQRILNGSKRFNRYYKGTWIPTKKVRVPKLVRPLCTSFYDDIIRLPSIISKVKGIQESILVMLKNIDSYLLKWKGYRTLWKFNKQQTCQKFLTTSPTCVDFDEKLLFYYNLHRTIR